MGKNFLFYFFMVILLTIGQIAQAQAPTACTVTYNITNQWNEGATVNVIVANNSAFPINGWQVNWTFPGNQSIVSLWDGTYSQSGKSVTVRNLSYNAVIPAGGSVTFGFNLSYSGSNPPPTAISLNGTSCTVLTRGVTPTPTTTARADSCAVTYNVTNQWNNGATVNVTLTNTSVVPINGWTATWVFPGNQNIVSLWDGTFTQSGQTVNVTNAPYNATIPAGGSVSFGFNLSYTGSNPPPTAIILNGISCTLQIRGVTPTPTPTATPTPTPTTTARFDSCTVTYDIVNQWATGATVNVTLSNTSALPINGWTVTWVFPGGQTITSLWNGTYTQTGATVNVTNAPFNATIPAGGSVMFGFNLAYIGSNPAPSTIILNGISCTVITRGVTPTPTPTPTTTARFDSCAVTYDIVNQWSNGATVNVTLSNTSALPINGWTVTWVFPGNQTITNLWNGTFTQTGATVNVMNAPFNATIPAGGSVMFGFNLAYAVSDPVPTTIILNGISCTVMTRGVTPTPTPTSTPTPTPTLRADSCSVNYTVVAETATAASVTITISNTSAVPINGWNLSFAFPGNQTVTQAFNATFVQSGNIVVLTNTADNATIPPGGSTTVALLLSLSGSNPSPTTFVLNGITCTIPTPTPTPTPLSGSCAVTYTVNAETATAASVTVTISNTGTTPINGWSLSFAFPGNQIVTQAFNANFSQTGTMVTAGGIDGNAVIPAGGSATFAMLLSFSGSNPNPTSFVLNGITCQ